MTTTIALETSKGDLPLALGLGIILIASSLQLTPPPISPRNSRSGATDEQRRILPLRLPKCRSRRRANHH